MTESLLSIENLRVAYPSPSNAPSETSWAVDDVSFNLQAGEKIGLVGESGCGKSTLGRAVMRLVPPQTQIEGDVKFKGESIFALTPSQLRQFRGEVVSLVFQDPMTRLDPLMTIGEHCLETLQAHQPQLSRIQAKEKALATLEAVRIPPERFNQFPHEFSGGMRQRVAIALALLLDPKVIVADEPTTSLDVTVSAEILRELSRLCQERQMGLLLISHDLAMVAEYCDRIAVMYNGKLVELESVKDIIYHPQHPYTKSLLQSALHLQATENILPKSAFTTEPLLRVQNLKQHYSLGENFLEQFLKKEKQTIKAIDDISFELYSGEIFGLVGESGCGKSTLSRTILQLIAPTAGLVEFAGEDITYLTPAQMRTLRRQMQMIFQDPSACLNPLMTIGHAIAEPLLIHQLCNRASAKTRVEEMLEKVGLTPVSEYYDRYPRELSGGQQQRVAIARALITQPKLVICDEPVSMLDATVQSQVLELMLDLKSEFNLTYLFITHDLWLARYFCDRIAVMNRGQIVEMGNTEQIFTNPEHPYTQKLINAAPLLASEKKFN
jgi:peptide/nickel transport system ATP-binding protein